MTNYRGWGPHVAGPVMRMHAAGRCSPSSMVSEGSPVLDGTDLAAAQLSARNVLPAVLPMLPHSPAIHPPTPSFKPHAAPLVAPADVINQSANVRVTLGQDKAEYMAKVVGVDPDKDIAVLQVRARVMLIEASPGAGMSRAGICGYMNGMG